MKFVLKRIIKVTLYSTLLAFAFLFSYFSAGRNTGYKLSNPSAARDSFGNPLAHADAPSVGGDAGGAGSAAGSDSGGGGAAGSSGAGSSAADGDSSSGSAG